MGRILHSTLTNTETHSQVTVWCEAQYSASEYITHKMNQYNYDELNLAYLADILCFYYILLEMLDFMIMYY